MKIYFANFQYFILTLYASTLLNQEITWSPFNIYEEKLPPFKQNILAEHSWIHKFHDYEKIMKLNLSEENQQCQVFQSTINFKNRRNFDIPSSERYFFNDFIILPQFNRILLARNDFKIYQLNITENEVLIQNQYFWNIQTILNAPKQPGKFKQIFIISNGIRIYFITNYGSVSLNMNEQIYSMIISGRSINQITRGRIEDVRINYDITDVILINNNSVLISTTMQIDVYQIGKNNYLIYQMSIDSLTTGLQLLSPVDIAYDSKSNVIFILDKNEGLISLDCDYKRMNFTIPIKHGKAFDFYHQTFIIIAEELTTHYDYAIEYFVDIYSRKSYKNRVYSNQYKLYDIDMFENYAILSGNDFQMLIYHSIYSGFGIEKEFRYPGNQELLKVMLQGQKKISAISQYQIHLFEVYFTEAYIECLLKVPSQAKLKITIFSTECASKDQSDSFGLCEITQEIQLTANKQQEEKDLSHILIFTLIGLCAPLLVCFILLMKSARNKEKEMIELSNKPNQLKL